MSSLSITSSPASSPEPLSTSVGKSLDISSDRAFLAVIQADAADYYHYRPLQSNTDLWSILDHAAHKCLRKHIACRPQSFRTRDVSRLFNCHETTERIGETLRCILQSRPFTGTKHLVSIIVKSGHYECLSVLVDETKGYLNPKAYYAPTVTQQIIRYGTSHAVLYANEMGYLVNVPRAFDGTYMVSGLATDISKNIDPIDMYQTLDRLGYNLPPKSSLLKACDIITRKTNTVKAFKEFLEGKNIV